MLKELYCISESPLDVLKFELWFVILTYSKEQSATWEANQFSAS
jgi:hypothetical protein